MVQQHDKQSLSVTEEVPNELSISFLYIPDSQTSANFDHFKKEKARSNRINSKPVDRVAATFHHCHHFIRVSVCNCCAFWSNVLSCRHRHAVIHHFSFKLKCSVFDSLSGVTEGW